MRPGRHRAAGQPGDCSRLLHTLRESCGVSCFVRTRQGTACTAQMPGPAAHRALVVLRLSICRGNTGPADEGRTITVKFGEGIAGVVAQNGTLTAAAAGSKQKRLLRVPAALVSKVHLVTAAGPTATAQPPSACAAAAGVTRAGGLMNIPDAYSHPLFNADVDRTTHFTTRNILCTAIKDMSGHNIAVVQVCASRGGSACVHIGPQPVRAMMLQ